MNFMKKNKRGIQNFSQQIPLDQLSMAYDAVKVSVNRNPKTFTRKVTIEDISSETFTEKLTEETSRENQHTAAEDPRDRMGRIHKETDHNVHSNPMKYN